jgi:hypothetical protein
VNILDEGTLAKPKAAPSSSRDLCLFVSEGGVSVHDSFFSFSSFFPSFSRCLMTSA